MYDGTYAGDRWSTLDSITAANAKSMKVVCSLALGETGAFQAGPVIVAETIYVTSMNNTYAIDATTCRLKWKSEYKPTGPIVFNTNRGVAYDSGTLFRDTEDAHLVPGIQADRGGEVTEELAVLRLRRKHVHATHQHRDERDDGGIAQPPAAEDPLRHGDFGLMIQRS